MDPRFKGRLLCAVADAWDRLEKAAVGSATEQVFNAHPCFPCVPFYSFYDEVLLFICAKLCLQLPMEGLQDIEEDVSDDHDKAEKHVNI